MIDLGLLEISGETHLLAIDNSQLVHYTDDVLRNTSMVAVAQ